MATFAEVPPGDEKSGEKIFKTKCARCHTVEKGAGHKQVHNLERRWFSLVLRGHKNVQISLHIGRHLQHLTCSTRELKEAAASDRFLSGHSRLTLQGIIIDFCLANCLLLGDFLVAFGLVALFSLSWNLDPAYTSRETLAFFALRGIAEMGERKALDFRHIKNYSEKDGWLIKSKMVFLNLRD